MIEEQIMEPYKRIGEGYIALFKTMMYLLITFFILAVASIIVGKINEDSSKSNLKN